MTLSTVFVVAGECGFDEPHPPHEYCVAQDDKPVDLTCPGVPKRRLFDLGNPEDHDWLAGYFEGFHAVPMLRNDRKVLVERCFALQQRVTGHHRHDHVTQKWCKVCPAESDR